jgi:hypothetical protein
MTIAMEDRFLKNQYHSCQLTSQLVLSSTACPSLSDAPAASARYAVFRPSMALTHQNCVDLRMVQSLFNAGRHGCTGFGGQGLGRCLDDVVNRDESSSGCTDGLGMHPGHPPCPQQSNSDHDIFPFKASSSISTPLPVKAAKTEVFDFHEFVDAVVGTFPSQT